MRSEFETLGQADLEGAGDVMAVAELLQLFLRELPDTVVPADTAAAFIQAQMGKWSGGW